MRLRFLVAVALLAAAAEQCHGRALTSYQQRTTEDEAYVVDTLKDIGRTLKEKFLVIGNQIQNKTQELKEAAGKHAQQIKEQLKGLGEQLTKSRDALAKKLFELFSPAKYSEDSGNIFQTLASLATLREKLQKFLTEVHSATGEKWEKLKVLIHELRSEIRQKVHELLHGSSAPVAYSALDVYEEDEDDDEAYVVETLKNISRSLKDQFLVIGNRIQNKTQELKQAAGEHAQQIKEQLKGLGEQLKKSRDALAKKLFELFSPAKYSEYSGNIFQTLASLATLREKLQKFLTEVHSATGEKWEKLKVLIHELRSEIRQKVHELLHGSSAPVAYSALDVYEEDEDDDEAYVVETLKNISRSLKDQFLVIGNRIQNKTQELKQAAGEHAQQIKEQLKGLGEQLKKSRDALAKKLFELFSPAKYSEYSGNIFQTLASLATLREKLQKFLTEVHSATGEKWEKLKVLIHELRSEIRQKVQELLHGSSAPVAYSALDVYEEDEDDDEAYVVETLKNIRKSLKDQFLVIGNHIQNKTQELKQAVGEHAQQIKEQLKGLGEQLKKSRDALAKKLFELFSPAKYSEYSGNIFQTLASLATLREKLQKFLTEVHSATGEKWEKLKVLIHELRSEIRQKVQELLHGSSAPVAYSALDVYEEDEDDDEAYVVETLKNIRKSLKDQFLVIGNHIQNKTQELKQAVGEHAQQIKEQLKGLGEQLKKSRDALAKKLFELFSPAKYSEYSGNIFQTLASLATLREKLQKFLTEVHSATGEKWEKLKVLIHELRSEIRQKVQELLHGSSAPVAYSALDVYEEDEDDDEAYVVETLKNIRKSLKDQFLVIGNHIQNKTQELKQAVGEHAQQIKEQLKGLGEQLKKSRDALAKKLFELFSPAKYSEYSGNIFQTLASLATLREKLQKFLTEVHSATGEKWEKLKVLIHELRSEIRQKVHELLHGSSAPVAYSALDVYEEDEDDDEAYVVETLKNISRSLKDQFLVIGNRIQNKTQELKQAAGEHAQQIKEQLKGLGEQLKKSRDALAKKLFELFSPAKYSEYSGNIFQTLASLATLREKLQKFLTEVHSATGEKWEKLKVLIHELRSEIRQKVQELLHGSSAPVAYSALDVYEEDEDDDEAYVVETLKNIRKSLKDQFLVIGNHIQNKTQELKQAVGEHAQQIKEQLKGLGEQLKKSRDALAKKLFELFSPAKYSEYSGNIFQTLASLATLREKLQKFLTEVHSATGEKWEKLKVLIHELRSEIRQKVHELLHGSSAPVAYSALDVYEEDEDDDEAYVVETLKNISRSLKDQFLVIGNRIQNKTQELKQAAGEHAQQIKEQLKGLGEQLKKSRDALAKKLFELFSPAKYSEYSGNIFQTLASLATLREKLQKFLTEVHSATGEKWEKLKVLIHELRSEIRQKVQELLHGSSAPVAYSALDVYEEDEDDDEAYVVETLKNIRKSLKDQFLVIGNHIQNKTQELKQAVGEHAQQIKEQLKGLGEQLKKSRDALAKKLFELFSPAKYSEYSGNIFQTLASLATLREKLQKFLTEVHSATGEKWEKLKVLIHELRSEIRQKVHELLHGSSAPVAYSALDVYEEDEDDDEAYVVETLKNISRSLKDQFLVIGNRIQNKTQELKQAAGEHAQQIKEQLKGLGEQLKKSRDALAKKLFELFSPAKYSEYSGNIFQTLASLATLREKLQKFLTEVHSATGEKWEKLKVLIHELRSEIRQKVQELLHGSSAPVAYSALDVYEEDEDDDEAYVVETLKNIRKSLKDQFLVIGNHIQNKTQELKQAVGEHAQQIKEQLKGLGEQLKKSRDALAKKLFELFSPAKYSEYSGNIFQTLASLATLREKLQKFLTEVHSATGEKWEKLKVLIHELRSEIRQKVHELLHGSSAPVAYSALDVYEEDEEDDEAYVVETLKNIRKSLKDQFLVIGNHIQNKTQELKQAVGEHAQQIKEQLKGLGEQLKKSRDALAKKLFELFSPAKYSEYSGNIFQTLASLATLREKLQKFLTEVHSATGEKWEKLKVLIHELRSEIRQKVQELLHGSSAPVAYSALDVYEEDEDDDEAYVVETLKNIRKSLKDQFLVIGNHIQNKTQELKQAVGEHAQQIKEQLKGLGEQLKKSRDALAKKLFELFSPAKYSEYSGSIFQTLASLATLREKLQKFLTEVHSATGEKWEKLKVLIHELRSEIRQKVHELLHGSSAPVAYSALDVYEEDEDDDEAYVVETLKNISRSLKDQFLVIGNRIQNKTQELKQAAGEHAQQIKEQLKGLGEQLKKSRDALAKKLFELFSPAKYSEYSGNIFQTLASLATLREKLQKFLTEVHSATGEKWEKLKVLIHELRSEIRQKVHELLHGSSAPVAYSALDVYEEDEDDDEAYVVETLKNISRSLKDQFLVIGNRIQNKTQELKQAAGEHAQQIKEQLKGLGEQLKKSRDALAKKLFELFSPAKYSEYSGNIFQTLASLATLREKLQKFLTEVHSATGEKWEKLKVLIHELRSEIRQKVHELLHGSSAPVAYSALDVYEEDEDDDEAYVVETLKNISRSLKDQFLVIGNHIQNKTQELKQAAGEHAQQIKEQLKGLGEQLKKSRDALAKKLFELFSPAKYSEYSGNIFQTLASLATLREKLQKFLTEVHSATGEKWEKLKALIHELRSEIRQKVQELFVQKSGTALYAHSDEDTAEPTSPVAQRALSLATRMFSLRWRLAVLQKELEEGGEEKWNDVKEKIDRLRKEIRYQTELYFNRTKPLPAFYYASDENEEDMYVLDTLKGVAHTLKEKFLVLGEKIKAKVAELRVTVGERAVVVQEQLNELYLQLQQARAQLKKQLFDLFRPSQYASFKENAVTIYEQLGVLREKLRKFLEDIKNLYGEKWERAKVTIAELRQEIREKVQELLGGGKKGPASYSAEDSASKKSLADSLKDAATTLKEKFQVLGKKIQAKVAELRGAVGEHAVTIKQQLESLKAKFNKAHSDLMTKLFDIFKVAQYDALDGAQNEQQQLSQLELKLEQLLCMTGASPAEAWPSLEGVVSELLQEIEAYLKKHE